MPAIDCLDSSSIPSDAISLIEAAPMPALDDGPKCEKTYRGIAAILDAHGWHGQLAEAGLWLLAGELERSHSVSQQDGSSEGSFWHGIMHRREGDYGNSKYWFRRVGQHPVHQELADAITRRKAELSSNLTLSDLCDGVRVANALVDDCQAARSKHPDWQSDLERICWWEWQLLFSYSLTAQS